MNNFRKSIKNLFYNLIGTIVTVAVGLILPRLYVVNYGSEINGLINSINQYIVYLSLFESGVGTVTMQALFMPISHNNINGINEILVASHNFYKKIGKWYFLCLLVLATVYPFVIVSSLKYYFVFIIVILSGMSTVMNYYYTATYTVLLKAEGRNYILHNLTTLLTVLSGVIKAVFVSLGYNVVVVLFTAFILNSLRILFIIYYVKKNYDWIDLSVKPNNVAIEKKNTMIIHQIAYMVFHNTDILILTTACDLKIVSVYSMYKLVITNLETFLSIMCNSVNFVLGQTFCLNLKKYIIRVDLFETYYSAISFSVLSVAYYLFYPFIVIYTSGVHDIVYADNLLVLLFIAVTILTVVRTPMLMVIDHAGHFRETLIPTLIETILNLIVSISFVKRYGIYGVLFGTIVALIYRTVDIILYSNYKILSRNPLKTVSIHCINFILFHIVLKIYDYLFFSININSYNSLITVGCIALIISLTLFLGVHSLICPKNIKEVIRIIKRK